MNIRFFFFLVFLLPSISYAVEPSSGLSAISDSVHTIFQFFQELPALIQRGMIYFSKSAISFYFTVKLASLQFCYSLASGVISSFNVTSTLQGFVSALPSNMQYCINELGFINGISFLLNCWATRFILNIIGW